MFYVFILECFLYFSPHLYVIRINICHDVKCQFLSNSCHVSYKQILFYYF